MQKENICMNFSTKSTLSMTVLAKFYKYKFRGF